MADKLKFVVFSLGCKVNQCEGQAMIEKLRKAGHEATDELGYADCYVINTCSVTMEADKKSRQTVARALKFNPAAKVYICGCSSQNDPHKYVSKSNIRQIYGTFGKNNIVNSIMSDIIGNSEHTPEICLTDMPREYEDDLTPELTKSRAFVKVQDGCNNFCSYCIIPYLRGRSRSRSLDSIMEEVKSVADKTREVVITGINVSDYGANIGLSLCDLVEALKVVPIRKRFGSLECNVISYELLRKMEECGFCDSFHLSMQSGSDSVLKRMNRHYTSGEFLDKVAMIREVFPNAGIMTDIIVGFPGETDDEFNQTLNTASLAAFSDIHFFPYSMRPGTVAAKLNQVQPEIVDERIEVMKKLKQGSIEKFISSQLGRVNRVFVEENDGEYNVGYTSNYVKVFTKAPIGTFAEHKLLVYYNNGIIGESYE